MIEIFQGRIGGGKTYSAVLRIAAHLSKGGHCYTNIELNPDGFKKLCRKKFGVEIDFDSQLHELPREKIPSLNKHIAAGRMDCPVLVVVDEAHLFFNARSWSKADPEFLTFLTQSRKVSVDVIFITQSMVTIDKQLRVQQQYVWAFKDFSKFIPWFPVPLIMCLQFDVDASTLLKYYFVRKQKLVFEAYNTLALLKPIDFGQEQLNPLKLLKAGKKRSVNYRRAKFFRRCQVGFGVFGVVVFVVALFRLVRFFLYD